MSWKGTVNRKKNCMTLFKVLKHLFHRSLPEPQIVKAAEDIEYKLMVENNTKKLFESDLARVVVGLRKLSSFKSKAAAKTQLKVILKSIGKHKVKSERPTNTTTTTSSIPTLPSMSLRLDLNPDELKMIEEEATAPIQEEKKKKSTTTTTTVQDSKTWPTKNNPFMHKDYVEDDAETRNKKLKQLSKNNRYIQYYQTLSDKYFPKLMGILDDIIHKCKSDRARIGVKQHFESLVKYLRGDGEPVTPVSVYVVICCQNEKIYHPTLTTHTHISQIRSQGKAKTSVLLVSKEFDVTNECETNQGSCGDSEEDETREAKECRGV